MSKKCKIFGKYYAALIKKVENGKRIEMKFPVSISNFSISSSAFYLLKFLKEIDKSLIVFTETREKGEILANLIKNFSPEIGIKFFNLSKFFPYSKILREKSYIPELLELLFSLILNKYKIIIVPCSIIFKKYISPFNLSKQSLNIKINEELDREALIEQLIEWGYDRESFVTFKGEFSVRGDIVDIFSPLYDNPIRINFFGDFVDSIFFFNPLTQRRINKEVKSVDIVSCSEILIKEDIYNEDSKIMPEIFNLKTSSIFDYIGNNYLKVLFTREKTYERLKT